MYRSSTPFPYTAAQLRHLPAGTVGHDMIAALDRDQHQLIPYYEKHDIKHIVFGYPMTEEGEVAMQFFMLGNGLVSFPVLATALMGLFTMPEYYTTLFKAFKRGRRVQSLAATDWFGLVECHTTLVQQTLLMPTQKRVASH
jgi:ubiquinone biosynthesis protein Coq4